ncbi:F-box protein CPR1-like [Gastrolobium bilobum]|uniref:F-box protein CPR1-like n=1 Tax=Gastrolobium bilobum TaxID=150636 RepID=UPI002AB138CD|nr:F-box protein CPR1-like [Gastrolobium bilobum]
MVRSIEDLPRELVSNILSRLPAKDLLKSKLVSKSWFHLITDPHFITNYYVFYNNLMHSQSQEQHLLVIRRPFLSGLKTYISLLSSNVNEPKGHVLNPPCEFNSDHKYWTEIMGPCNGIYFLEGNPNVIMNPSLTQLKALPQSHFICPIGTYSFTDYAGFGFDSNTNDYKVVVIKDLWLKETDERQHGYWTAELYSLNSNSWRKLDASDLPLPFEIWGSSRVYTYVNNCCHWWGFVDESGRKEDVVVAFDMVHEVFRKIKVPRIRESSEASLATLAPFDESATIGVIVSPVSGKEKRYDVWVMKDYWDEGSWIKQYTVGPTEVIYKLVGFYGRNQFLWNDGNEGLVLYDSDSQQRKDLGVYGKHDSLRAARYMESLVSLQRGNEFCRQFVSCSLVPDPLLNRRELMT